MDTFDLLSVLVDKIEQLTKYVTYNSINWEYEIHTHGKSYDLPLYWGGGLVKTAAGRLILSLPKLIEMDQKFEKEAIEKYYINQENLRKTRISYEFLFARDISEFSDLDENEWNSRKIKGFKLLSSYNMNFSEKLKHFQ